MSAICLNCGKELQHEKGRKKKSFCNATCRSNYWYKTNKDKKEPKMVQFATYKKAVDKIAELEKRLKEGAKIEYKPTAKASCNAKPMQPYLQDELGQVPSPVEAEALIAGIEAKIAAKRAEMEAVATTGWGKKIRDKAQLEINLLNTELTKLRNPNP